MRAVVFFDLPVLTEKNRKEYRQFRKLLIKSGFIMVQESVYCKLVPNTMAADALIEAIKKKKPSEGVVQVLRVTEKQYSKMEFIVGTKKTDVLDSDKRIVII